jgi:hypothetical protein
MWPIKGLYIYLPLASKEIIERLAYWVYLSTKQGGSIGNPPSDIWGSYRFEFRPGH